ncbi:MAG: glycosyltransferase [Vicinamibacterales bacterium]|jgi:glycosyltransferase involved in cell wall biosynthesis
MPVKVSVIVPNYNYASYLDERLRSLLDQTLGDFELLVLDDASTDGSRAVIEKYAGDPRIRAVWFDTRSGSAYQRWNDGAAMAHGEYLYFAGADDSCEPALLAVLAGVLDANPPVGLAYCRSRIIDAGGTPQSVSPSHPRWDRDFITTAAIELPFLLDQKTIPTASAVLLRRSLLDRCGGFDTTFRLAADHMLWARMLREADVAYVAQPLNRFRSHDRTVRASAPRSVTVRERYRLYGFVLDAFDVDAVAREALRERLARNWAECLAQDRAEGRAARHRAVYQAAKQMDPAAGRRLVRLLTERTLGVRLRGPVAIARYAGRRTREAWDLLKGRHILWRYSRHYRRAQRAFRRAHPAAAPNAGRIHDLGVIVSRPGDASAPLPLAASHGDVVSRVAAAADAALGITAQCQFVPPLGAAMPGPRTEAQPEVINRQVIAIQLLDPLSLDGLPELCEPLMDEIERRFYGSFVVVDKVYVYRSPISEQTPDASWLWHYDNHPREVIKVMVYLTDVNEGTAPFEFVRERGSGRPAYGAPLAPLHWKSRVPSAEVERYLANGYERHAVTGPRGTVVMFDDNVIHRATLARTSHRDVLVFQVRPATFRAEPRLDARWTGSFLHQYVNRDPSDLRPHPKRRPGAA